MNKEAYMYYNQWFEEIKYLEELSDVKVLPYVLLIDRYSSGVKSGTYFLFLIVVFSTIYILFLLISLISKSYIKNIKKFVASNPSFYNIDEIEYDLASAVNYTNIWIGNKYTYFIKGTKAYIIVNKDIIWVYLYIYTHRMNGVPIIRKVNVNVRTKNKKEKYSIKLRKEKLFDKVVEAYKENYKNIIFGHNNELEKMYKTNFEDFLEYSNNNQ